MSSATTLAPGEPPPTDRGSGPDAPPPRSFASGARILSIGIASTGVFTFAYLATASHVLDPAAYSRISLCWAIMFVILSVIYRPIEQLLSRTIADRRARGLHGHSLRVPAAIQFGFAVVFLVVALVLYISKIRLVGTHSYVTISGRAGICFPGASFPRRCAERCR